MDKGQEEKDEQNQFEEMIQGLIDNKYGCSNDFVNATTVTGLRENIKHADQSGVLKAAGIGNQKNLIQNSQIRGDKIKWIDDKSLNQFEQIYLKKVGNFIAHLNKTCFTSIKSFDSHYANYEPNSFYKRHVDQFKNEKGRKYSLVLFLNQDWQKADGGLLSLYPEGAPQRDISPIGGRMVFFKSDEMEHEVHPSSTRDRRSIAAWLKD
ncbi:2OG-Fe(II) oxygenase [uncultured Algoriphagus sp.]|uniref:2OG-Fe(II) oxygenase n=1 Tax=uncultured Algoriphagus sp. TaxID=417365 RepID=UPI0030EEB1FE|tara:strand:+ start:66054 stop:66677 length:624 start_codon:yes stop_codon:yes gene_type:complete